MEEQHSFDEFFRESLADYRETPPPAAWDMVAARLDDDDRKRRGFFFWPWTVLSLLLLVGGAIWLYGWSTNRSFPASGNAAQRQAATADAADVQSIPIAAGMNPTAAATEPCTASISEIRTPEGNHTNAGMAQAPQTTGSQLPLSESGQNVSGRTGQSGNTHGNGFNGSETTSRARASSGTGHSNNVADSRPQATAITGDAENGPASGARSVQPDMRALDIPENNPALSHSNNLQRPSTEGVPNASGSGTRSTGIDPVNVAARGTTPTTFPNPVLSAITPTQAPANAQLPAGAAKSDQSGIVPEAGVAARGPNAAGNLPAGLRPKEMIVPAPLPAPVETPVRTPDPAEVLAALEPVMHLFGGAPLPPVFNLYQTGLLEPERYFEPIAPAPVVTAVVDPVPDPAAAMYPPDSNVKAARKPMSLMAFIGYERGIKTPPRNMFTVGLSMLWQLNEKFSVGMQPALLYGNMPRTTLTTDRTYQRSAVDITRFTTRDYSPSILGQIDTVNNYVIREAFDSIIVRGTYVKGSLYHLELPLILQFNPFGAAFRMYGGPSMYFGGSMRIHSEGATQTYTIDRKDSIVQSEKMTEEQIKNYFGKSSLPSYSTYDPNAHSFERLDPVRFGYQFGVGYQKNRLNFDLSVRQQLTGYHQLSSELRQIYALPVFRLSFGYSLIPLKAAAPKPLTP